MTYRTDNNRRLVLDDAAWAMLCRVNTAGNAMVWQDDPTWGTGNRWQFPSQNGGRSFDECDGYVFWKMDALMKAGFPPSCLLFSICLNEVGESHAVLCVTTDKGDFVLDCRFPEVRTYEDLRARGYTFTYRTSLGGSLRDLWERIQTR